MRSMSGCVFCRIARGEASASIVYKDEEIVAFEDINPQAPYHILVIPKDHIPSIMDLSSGNIYVVGKIYNAIKEIARSKNLEKGFRVVVNCGPLAGQSVNHLHFHLLSGRRLGWPPG